MYLVPPILKAPLSPNGSISAFPLPKEMSVSGQLELLCGIPVLMSWSFSNCPLPNSTRTDDGTWEKMFSANQWLRNWRPSSNMQLYCVRYRGDTYTHVPSEWLACGKPCQRGKPLQGNSSAAKLLYTGVIWLQHRTAFLWFLQRLIASSASVSPTEEITNTDNTVRRNMGWCLSFVTCCCD